MQMQPAPEEGYITLYKATGESLKVTQDMLDIGGGEGYVKAQVHNSQPIRRIWIIYDRKNYGSSGTETSTKVLRVPDQLFDFKVPIKSVRGFNDIPVGMIVFEATYFRGACRMIQPSVPDLEQKPGSITVSSLIVTAGAIWALYKEPNYGGDPLGIEDDYKYGPGDYKLPKGVANKVQSVLLLRIPALEEK